LSSLSDCLFLFFTKYLEDAQESQHAVADTYLVDAQQDRPLQRVRRARNNGSRTLLQGAGAGLFRQRRERARASALVPVPGGVLTQDGGNLLGAVGASGDTFDNDNICDNDEICAIAGIEAAGLTPNAG
jgi:hypothetical protein